MPLTTIPRTRDRDKR